MASLACVRADTPLTQALGLLLEAGVSCLPVVDASGVLLDIYARADITMLAKVRLLRCSDGVMPARHLMNYSQSLACFLLSSAEQRVHTAAV